MGFSSNYSQMAVLLSNNLIIKLLNRNHEMVFLYEDKIQRKEISKRMLAKYLKSLELSLNSVKPPYAFNKTINYIVFPSIIALIAIPVTTN